MTVETLGIIVGLIVVVGFAATILITLLALAGFLPAVKEKYLGKLFVLVVVELAGAGFWLFGQTFQPPEPPELVFQPPLPAEVYVFGRDGEPVQRTELLLGDITERTFNDTDVTFDFPRKLELTPNRDALWVKSQRTEHQFGTVSFDELSDDIINSVTPIDRHLGLGKYYAECLDFPECTERRNAPQAIFHLTWVLWSKGATSAHQKSATMSLFHLQHDLHDCDTFLLLIDKIKKYRPITNRYAEIGDTYQTMCRALHLTFGQCKTVYRQSLQSLLRFLSLRSVNPGTDLYKHVVSQATDLARYLGVAELTSILSEVEATLASRSEDQQSEPIPMAIKNRLGSISDAVQETFQCPT